VMQRPRLPPLSPLLTDAYLSLTARPLRTAAMVAGIVLGVASATAAVVIADTQEVQINKRFDAQRSEFVVLQANGDTSREFPARGVAAVARLDPVSAAGEFSIWNESAPVSTTRFVPAQRAPLLAVSASGGIASGTDTTSGISLTAVDRLQRKHLAWIGVTLARRLGITMRTPSTVLIFGRPYTVAGIVRNEFGFTYVDTSVLVSSALARRAYGAGTNVRFLAHVRPGAAGAVARYALAVLDPSKEQRLADATPPDGRLLVGHVASDLRRIGVALGLFVGFIGMVAVANTLSMAVAQRSRELGLRAAMGWSRRRLAGLIIAESAVAGIVAAVIGCGFGLLGAWVWCRIQEWQFIVPPFLGVVVVAAATGASILGGLLPARRAASVSPLEAMRG